MERKERIYRINETFALTSRLDKVKLTFQHTQIYCICTLWLLSPSRLAVVTKQVPSSRDEDNRMRSQGNDSSSLTKTTSPTCDRHTDKKQICLVKFVSTLSDSMTD